MKALIDAYLQGEERLRAAIAGLTEEELRFKPAPGKWSIHEIIVHVADAEIVGVQRMKKVLAEERPLLTSYDQDRWANTLHYDKQDREQSFMLFKLLREGMRPILEQVTDEQGQRIGLHDEAGELSFRQLLERYVNHVEEHLAQIEHVKNACQQSKA
ncbi:DinB family protein [Brevibacillus migulae]|uniref:DinB family protein n=1 Tax=Brevibacillus migulae TaxID=1644114 RepID=UPI00106DFA5C|nr:DinB family protein [Brevibacillus migulae]